MIDLRIKRSYISEIKAANASLGAAFEANSRVLDDDCEDLQLTLRVSKDRRRGALSRILTSLKSLARRADLRDNIAKFVVSGKTNDTTRVEILDLLQDKLVSRRRILKVSGTSRAIEQVSAFAEIREAYSELNADLEQAASVFD